MLPRTFIIIPVRLVCAFAFPALLYGCSVGSSVEHSGEDFDPPSTLAAGSGVFLFTGSDGARDRPVAVLYYRPLGWNPSDPIVFVMHGSSRNGHGYRAAWIPHAERYRFLLVVPEFSLTYYRAGRYSQGNVLAREGTPTDSRQWSFTTVEKIFDEVKRRGGATRSSYRIYGHSGGGQFVHRMVLLMPQVRIEKAVAANAGFYTMPTLEATYPYGLGQVLDRTQARAQLETAFGREMTILLGAEDRVITNPGLRRPEAMAQGEHRVERGDTFFETARREALRLGVSFRWHLQTVPGAGHRERDMVDAAAVILAKEN
jgi:predicted esterase